MVSNNNFARSVQPCDCISLCEKPKSADSKNKKQDAINALLSSAVLCRNVNPFQYFLKHLVM